MNFAALTLDDLADSSLDELAELGLNDSAPAITMPTYLQLAEADALADEIGGVPAYAAASSTVRRQLLVRASAKVDASHHWQGRKYSAEQELEFPRRPYGDDRVWSLDKDTGAAVVPPKIRIAVLIEANSMADGEHDRLANAQAAGLVSQTTGGMSESFRQANAGQAGATPLCREADQFVAGFVLRSGRLL